MSIIVGLANKNEWCIATDEQKTKLNTDEGELGFKKSRKVTDNLFVGYAGHTDACEAIIDFAIKFHIKIKGNSNDPVEFIESLKKSIEVQQLEFGYDYVKNFLFSFLIVGVHKTKPVVLLFGTSTNFIPVGVQEHPDGTQISFLVPEDVSYKECLSIYNRLTMEHSDNLSLAQLGQLIVEEVSRRSKYCGGEPQVLRYP